MKNKALSPYISTALIILISITALSLSLTILTPALNQAKDSAIINEAFNNLGLIDSTIREVASESVDSKRTINLKVTEGTYRVDSANDFINFTYKMKENLGISGKRDKINITVSAGEITFFIKYTNLGLQGSDHFSKGDNSIVILNNGTNPTTNYPLIYVGR
jgi:hypothetical protein